MPLFGVIAGSGLYDIPGLEITDSVKLNTPYGEPSDIFRIGNLLGKEVAFLPRHGTMHHIQPHRVNYRANIWGFRELGIKKIISIGASGGITSNMKPGVITVIDQLIDTTSGRQSTFYDENEVVHIDFTEPFCPDMRDYILKAAKEAGVAVMRGGTYICTNGPRLETAAEIKVFLMQGADMVGMTALPEAALARELEICLANISITTNYAAGIVAQRLTTSEVIDTMNASTEKLKSILKGFFSLTFSAPACSCGDALKDSKM
jgi:5'-methylthioadenosine phosphorylase